MNNILKRLFVTKKDKERAAYYTKQAEVYRESYVAKMDFYHDDPRENPGLLHEAMEDLKKCLAFHDKAAQCFGFRSMIEMIKYNSRKLKHK